ncbi:MAG: HlyD family secretion protein [Bacteroidales bacterium]
MRIVLLLLAGAVTAMACGRNNNGADAFGSIETDDVIISSEIGGKLVKLTVDEGDRLILDQSVGLVDTIPLQLKLNQLYAQVDVARAKLQGIDAQVAVQDEQVKLAKIEFDRVKRLLADSAATQRQFDDVEGRYSIAIRQRASIGVQRNGVTAEIETLNAQADQLKDQIQRCSIKSPLTGTVITKYVSQGELVVTGKPVCRVAMLDTVYARVYVDETQLSGFNLGKKLKVFVDGADGKLIGNEGVITWISPEAEFTPKIIQTRNERVNLVYAVKVKIPNVNGMYKIGMPVEVKKVD